MGSFPSKGKGSKGLVLGPRAASRSLEPLLEEEVEEEVEEAADEEEDLAVSSFFGLVARDRLRVD